MLQMHPSIKAQLRKSIEQSNTFKNSRTKLNESQKSNKSSTRWRRRQTHPIEINPTACKWIRHISSSYPASAMIFEISISLQLGCRSDGCRISDQPHPLRIGHSKRLTWYFELFSSVTLVKPIWRSKETFIIQMETFSEVEFTFKMN